MSDEELRSAIIEDCCDDVGELIRELRSRAKAVHMAIGHLSDSGLESLLESRAAAELEAYGTVVADLRHERDYLRQTYPVQVSDEMIQAMFKQLVLIPQMPSVGSGYEIDKSSIKFAIQAALDVARKASP